MATVPAADKPTSTARVLVVDDEETLRDILLQAIGAAGYLCRAASSGEEALALAEEEPFDILVTDIKMPGIDGIELLRRLRDRHGTDSIVMTGYLNQYGYEEIVKAGGNDFIRKPLTPSELVVRLGRLARERLIVQERNSKHEELRSALSKLDESYHDTIHRLIRASQFKDEETGDHVMRIGRYSVLIAQRLGEFTDSEIERLSYAAPMHDVGKIGIPDNILLKPGKLTREEFEVMKGHTTIGGSILANPKSDILETARRIALTHHEQWDGKGYPQGLTEESIPLPGRIVKLVDVFDALTSSRPYKEPYPIGAALEIIVAESGKHFDPRIVDIFTSVKDEILEIRREVGGVREARESLFTWSERDRDYLPVILGKKQPAPHAGS